MIDSDYLVGPLIYRCIDALICIIGVAKLESGIPVEVRLVNQEFSSLSSFHSRSSTAETSFLCHTLLMILTGDDVLLQELCVCYVVGASLKDGGRRGRDTKPCYHLISRQCLGLSAHPSMASLTEQKSTRRRQRGAGLPTIH